MPDWRSREDDDRARTARRAGLGAALAVALVLATLAVALPAAAPVFAFAGVPVGALVAALAVQRRPAATLAATHGPDATPAAGPSATGAYRPGPPGSANGIPAAFRRGEPPGPAATPPGPETTTAALAFAGPAPALAPDGRTAATAPTPSHVTRDSWITPPDPDGEHLDDRGWEMSDFAEHYRQMAEARRQAEAASEAKSRFLATVSHEVRTPLSGVLGLAGVLLDTELTAEQETFARAIRSSGELMLGLVDDMLDFAKIEAGRFDLNPQPLALEALAEEVAELFAARAEAKGVDLAVYVAPAVPPLVDADGPRLRQVLINLVANAVKFTDAGGVTLVVDGAAGGLRFAVLDSGPGVPPGEAERIFGPFSVSRRGGAGNGLGLSISREIVRRMGGDITVASRPEGGAAFAFALALPAVAAAPREAPDLAGRRILILAPAGSGPDALVRHLADGGARATLTDNPHRAAALAGAAAAAGEDFDALLFDRRIGERAAATIRTAAGRPLPTAVLIVPGRRPPVDAMRAAGFDAYLVRPVRRTSLLKIVEQIMAPGDAFTADPGDRREPRPAPATGKGLRILLAEDDVEINALLIRAVLQRFGHSVVEVADGDAAILAAATADPPFHAAVLDLHLRGSGGLAVAAAIRFRESRSGGPRLRLLAVTADNLPATREAALAAGFDAFLAKPATPDVLLAALVAPAAVNAA